MGFKEFINSEELNTELLNLFEQSINADIINKGEAIILLSGGSTPLSFYSKFKELNVDWKKVHISLTDERYVPIYSKKSNYHNIINAIEDNKVLKEQFQSMIFDLLNFELNVIECNQRHKKFLKQKSVVLLGMGDDGHTASLFANNFYKSKEFHSKESKIISNYSPIEPKIRITHNKSSILNTKNLILYLKGNKKKEAFNSSTIKNTPICHFIKQSNPLLQIFWTS
jgi:6-phosphogluconolactonase